MKLSRVLATAAVLILHAVAVYAEDVVVSTSAQIIDGDIGRAREVAIRRALARAVESKSAIVNSQTFVTADSVSDTTQIRSTSCTGEVHILSQSIQGDEISVTANVDVLPHGCEFSCTRKHINKIAITDFAFEYPDQLSVDELNILKYKSASEIAKLINSHKTLIARSADMDYPYVSAAKAPIPYFDKTLVSSTFNKISNNYGVQYILSGVYRDIGVRGASNHSQRNIQIDVYLHEGYSGKLIYSKNFIAISQNGEKISSIYAVGSPEFYETKFGSLWRKSLDDIASWVVEQSNCLPTISSILKLESKQITINAGLDSGMSEGDTVDAVFYNSTSTSIKNAKNIIEEKKTTLNLVIKSINSEYSILESIDKLDFQTRVQVGDIISIR